MFSRAEKSTLRFGKLEPDWGISDFTAEWEPEGRAWMLFGGEYSQSSSRIRVALPDNEGKNLPGGDAQFVLPARRQVFIVALSLLVAQLPQFRRVWDGSLWSVRC